MLRFFLSFNLCSYSDKTVDLHEYEAEAVASLVKLYLRELPENILTAALLPKFNELSSKLHNSTYNIENCCAKNKCIVLPVFFKCKKFLSLLWPRNFAC